MFFLQIVDYSLDIFVPGVVALSSHWVLAYDHPLTCTVSFLDQGTKFFFVPPGFVAVLARLDCLSLTTEGTHDRFSDELYALIHFLR